jgi:predicted nucleic acid-binding protein
VLAYPKFDLNDEEIEGLLRDELLPFLITVRPRRRLSVVRRDPDDDKFLECAVAGKARYLVTGDRALREIGRFRRVTITTVGSLLRDLEAGATPPRR